MLAVLSVFRVFFHVFSYVSLLYFNFPPFFSSKNLPSNFHGYKMKNKNGSDWTNGTKAKFNHHHQGFCLNK